MAFGAREDGGWVGTLRSSHMERLGERGAQWSPVEGGVLNTKTQRTRRFRPDAVVHKVRLLLGGHEVMVISWKPNRGWEPGWSR